MTDNILNLVDTNTEESPKSLDDVIAGMKEHAGELEEGIIIALTEEGLIMGSNIESVGNINMLLDVAKFQLLTEM